MPINNDAETEQLYHIALDEVPPMKGSWEPGYSLLLGGDIGQEEVESVQNEKRILYLVACKKRSMIGESYTFSASMI